MIKQYSAVYGQSLLDVCLQVYGTLDLLVKLCLDSGVSSVNDTPKSQQVFVYDDQLTVRQGVRDQFGLPGKIYATDAGFNGETYYTIQQQVPPHTNQAPPILNNPGGATNMYESPLSTSYTSNADGLTEFYPLDANGASMAGYDIVQIEKEIKPLKASEFVWNKVQGKITLIGNTLDNEMTAFIIYKKTITP